MSELLIFDVVVDDPVNVTVLAAPSTDVVVETPQPSDVVLVDVAGPPGPPGPHGDPGPPGPPGSDGEFLGTAWWSGEGEPDVVVGAKANDRYIDTLTGIVYVLK